MINNEIFSYIIHKIYVINNEKEYIIIKMIGRFYVAITEIKEMDEDYIYRDKNDGEYLIGNYVILNDTEKEIIGSIISNKVFFSL